MIGRVAAILPCVVLSTSKLAELEQMFVRALVGYEKVLGPNHTSTLDAVNNSSPHYLDKPGFDLRACSASE